MFQRVSEQLMFYRNWIVIGIRQSFICPIEFKTLKWKIKNLFLNIIIRLWESQSSFLHLIYTIWEKMARKWETAGLVISFGASNPAHRMDSSKPSNRRASDGLEVATLLLALLSVMASEWPKIVSKRAWQVAHLCLLAARLVIFLSVIL